MSPSRRGEEAQRRHRLQVLDGFAHTARNASRSPAKARGKRINDLASQALRAAGNTGLFPAGNGEPGDSRHNAAGWVLSRWYDCPWSATLLYTLMQP